MKTRSSFSGLIFFVIIVIGAVFTYLSYNAQNMAGAIWIGVITFVVALLVSAAIKIADQWNRAVVLRLGKFHSLRGPGIFFIIPIIDTVPYWIDTACKYYLFHSRKDPYKRYSACRCRCCSVLESRRS